MQSYPKKLIRFILSLIGRQRWPTQSSQLLILAYHRILPKNDPRYLYEQPTMIVTPESLDRNLGWVSEHFKFIGLNSWLSMCLRHEAPIGKYCAITFDDGWIDNLEYAMPVLEKHMVPATIFCVSGVLNRRNNFWPGLLTKLIYESSIKFKSGKFIDFASFYWLNKVCAKTNINWANPKVEDYNLAIENAKAYSDQKILSFIDNAKQVLALGYKDERQLLSISELKSMVDTGLIEIGSHTVNHTRFSDNTENLFLISEIEKSKKELAHIFNTEVNTFCYPNGYHPTNSVEIVSRNYLGACTLEKGWNSPKTDFSKLRRVSLHETVASNKSHFKARLSGWL